MKNSRFYFGTAPSGYQFNFTPSIFNQTKHLLLQRSEGWNMFYILDDDKKSVVGLFNSVIEGGVSYSPYKAPFGSFEFSNDVPPKMKFEFIKFCQEELKNLGAREIQIKCPPVFYDQPNLSYLNTCFLNQGFEIKSAEVGTCIEVSGIAFDDIIKPSEKQLIKQSRRAKFYVEQLAVSQIELVYSFIDDHLSQKGYALSMQLNDLKKTVNTFANQFFLFGCYDGDRLIAASISVWVHEHVLYNFYIAHDAAYNSKSPVILLIEALYNHCKKINAPILDLGTSALKGIPNFPLLDFKLRMGGTITEKFIFYKLL